VTSVVICAYTIKRWDRLQAAVESVERQSGPAEIVIVIDHNDDLLDMSARRWPHHRVVANRFAKGLSGARNTGVTEASGELIAFLDDDAEAREDWLASIESAFAGNSAIGGVGGRVEPAWEAQPPGWLPAEFWWVIGCSYVGLPGEGRAVRNPIGANMAFSKAVFEKVGGFREEIGRIGTIPLGCEETELSIRAGAAGFAIWYVPEAVVDHWVPADRTTPGYFVRRCHAEGLSKALVSGLAGRADGLQSERKYVSETLPHAARAATRQLARGPRRIDSFGRLTALVVGVLAATAGYVRGTIAFRKRRDPLGPAPALEWEKSETYTDRG
jgi:glucosyl-dolichyl phosphate glucuronosyltransferase